MSTTILCAECGRTYQWKAELAGKQVKCKCGGKIAVPAGAEGEMELDLGALATATASARRGQSAPLGVTGDAGVLDEYFEVRQSRTGSVCSIIFGVVALLLVPFALLFGVEENRVLFASLAGLAGVTAIAIGFFWLKVRPVRLVMDATGLEIPMYNIGPIPWHDIVTVDHVEIDPGPLSEEGILVCLCMNLGPAGREQLKKSSWFSVLSQLQRTMKKHAKREYDLVLQSGDLDYPIPDLVEMVRARCAAAPPAGRRR